MCIKENLKNNSFRWSTWLKVFAGRHLDLYMQVEIFNCGIGVDYVSDQRELIPFAWNIAKLSHFLYAWWEIEHIVKDVAI